MDSKCRGTNKISKKEKMVRRAIINNYRYQQKLPYLVPRIGNLYILYSSTWTSRQKPPRKVCRSLQPPSIEWCVFPGRQLGHSPRRESLWAQRLNWQAQNITWIVIGRWRGQPPAPLSTCPGKLQCNHRCRENDWICVILTLLKIIIASSGFAFGILSDAEDWTCASKAASISGR